MDEYIYRVYVTDVIKSMAESWGCEVLSRFKDLLESQEELEDGDEVALMVIEKLGLKVKTNGLYETESDPVA